MNVAKWKLIFIFSLMMTVSATGVAQDRLAPILDIDEIPQSGPFERRKPQSVEEVLKDITVDIANLEKRFGSRLTLLDNPEIANLIKETDSDSEMQRLMKQRCLFAVNEFASRLTEFRGGRSPVIVVIEASDRIAESMLALDPPATARSLILQQRLAGAKEIEKYATLNLGNGMGTVQEVFRAAYLRTTAEIELLRDVEAEDADN